MNKQIKKVDKKGVVRTSRGDDEAEDDDLKYDIVFGSRTKMRDFGDPTGYEGIFCKQPFREAEMYEIYRGHSATGIRGIIDPFDPKNAYRIQCISDLDEKTPKL